ncbi:MAG: hypothetical protein HS100_07620 [Anaerolineales bacterium]|nr:MAG: hypothetical protein EDM79_08080 [Chloroflexota bacterium]MBE7433770.1 hypothetical protein [Anaerolineales bacterium]GJQ36516.1 MAG: hypothetical protein JETCAE01_25260 [Anaerolineaceae bacterium]
MKNTIASYLKVLQREMKRNGTFHADHLEELEGHLLEAVETNLRRGMNLAEAEEEALRRFGSVNVVLSSFEKERFTVMQKILLGIAAIAGLFSLYVDTRPNWDDTGVLAMGILFVCGMLALFGFQRPWVLALAVGAWIPLHGILISHNYGSIIAIIIAFIGAYAGWAFRAGINKMLHPLLKQ